MTLKETFSKTSSKLWMVFALFGVVFLVLALFLSLEVFFQDRIYPGISVKNISVGGKNKDVALNILNSSVKNLSEIKLASGPNVWILPISDLGINMDIYNMSEDAYRVGHSSNLISNWKERWIAFSRNTIVTPRVIVHQDVFDAAIASVSATLDVPAQEPEAVWNPLTKSVQITPGENGRLVDIVKLRKLIVDDLEAFNNRGIEIPIISVTPKLSEDQILRATAFAQDVVKKTLTVTYTPDFNVWKITGEQLLTWVDLSLGDWKRENIRMWVSELANSVARPASNALLNFTAEGKVDEFKPAVEGVALVVDATTDNILAQLRNMQNVSEGSVEISVATTRPEIMTADVNSLGIRELIGKGESWFSGSINNRIFNIKKAAAAMNGILVPPGETFSFNKYLGEVSAATGYKQAYVINQGKTVLGDGGGVCQVSSTLFRSVLAAGLPITERTAHAYRVHYYEENYQAGFDATVYQPAPDFKFVNDTPSYILIQTNFNEKAKKLTFSLYGTSDGRLAEVSKARTWEVTAPPPDLYIDDPNLPIGQIRQTEHAARGAKVAFDWKVTRGDTVLQERTFYSNYKPWQAVYMRGTKI